MPHYGVKVQFNPYQFLESDKKAMAQQEKNNKQEPVVRVLLQHFFQAVEPGVLAAFRSNHEKSSPN